MHRISDNRMAGTPLKNLKMFAQLCGSVAAERVVLTTTMWGKLSSPGIGEKREKEMKEKVKKRKGKGHDDDNDEEWSDEEDGETTRGRQNSNGGRNQGKMRRMETNGRRKVEKEVYRKNFERSNNSGAQWSR